MPTCRICGDDAEYRPLKNFRALCDNCDRTTPVKVSRAEFDRIYWNGHPETVPPSIRWNFYEDYSNSSNTLDEYIKLTTTTI